MTSQISRHPPVRAALLEVQRRMGQSHDSIVEGRDIGTVVFPNAELKIFYTASVEARARRRWQELINKGESIAFDDIVRDISERDARDTQRAAAPLRKANDAVDLDTSEMTFAQSCDALAALIQANARPK